MTSYVVAVLNQKGGVGKTTTIVNISTVLAAIGKRVLLVDFDPQGNASSSLGINDRTKNIYEVVINRLSIYNAIHKTMLKNLDIIPTTIDLVGFDSEIDKSHKNHHFILKTSLTPIMVDYDFIFIDCPPTINFLTLNALAASGYLIIPVQVEFLAMEGLAHLMNVIDLIKKSININLKIAGIVLTMYDKKNTLSFEIEKEIMINFPKYLYTTKIPRNIKLAEAPSFGQPGVIYDVKSSGSVAYIQLAREISESIINN
jgi:chromosome partitioning protein